MEGLNHFILDTFNLKCYDDSCDFMDLNINYIPNVTIECVDDSCGNVNLNINHVFYFYLRCVFYSCNDLLLNTLDVFELKTGFFSESYLRSGFYKPLIEIHNADAINLKMLDKESFLATITNATETNFLWRKRNWKLKLFCDDISQQSTAVVNVYCMSKDACSTKNFVFDCAKQVNVYWNASHTSDRIRLVCPYEFSEDLKNINQKPCNIYCNHKGKPVQNGRVKLQISNKLTKNEYTEGLLLIGESHKCFGNGVILLKTYRIKNGQLKIAKPLQCIFKRRSISETDENIDGISNEWYCSIEFGLRLTTILTFNTVIMCLLASLLFVFFGLKFILKITFKQFGKFTILSFFGFTLALIFGLRRSQYFSIEIAQVIPLMQTAIIFEDSVKVYQLKWYGFIPAPHYAFTFWIITASLSIYILIVFSDILWFLLYALFQSLLGIIISGYVYHIVPILAALFLYELSLIMYPFSTDISAIQFPALMYSTMMFIILLHVFAHRLIDANKQMNHLKPNTIAFAFMKQFFSFLDFGTDIGVIVVFAQQSQWSYVVIQSLILIVSVTIQYYEAYKLYKSILTRITDHILILLSFGKAYARIKMWDRNTDIKWKSLSHQLDLWETMYESLPSITFQLYVLLGDNTNSDTSNSILISLSVTLISLSLSIANKLRSHFGLQFSMYFIFIFIFILCDLIVRIFPVIVFWSAFIAYTNEYILIFAAIVFVTIIILVWMEYFVLLYFNWSLHPLHFIHLIPLNMSGSLLLYLFLYLKKDRHISLVYELINEQLIHCAVSLLFWILSLSLITAGIYPPLSFLGQIFFLSYICAFCFICFSLVQVVCFLKSLKTKNQLILKFKDNPSISSKEQDILSTASQNPIDGFVSKTERITAIVIIIVLILLPVISSRDISVMAFQPSWLFLSYVHISYLVFKCKHTPEEVTKLLFELTHDLAIITLIEILYLMLVIKYIFDPIVLLIVINILVLYILQWRLTQMNRNNFNKSLIVYSAFQFTMNLDKMRIDYILTGNSTEASTVSDQIGYIYYKINGRIRPWIVFTLFLCAVMITAILENTLISLPENIVYILLFRFFGAFIPCLLVFLVFGCCQKSNKLNNKRIYILSLLCTISYYLCILVYVYSLILIFWIVLYSKLFLLASVEICFVMVIVMYSETLNSILQSISPKMMCEFGVVYLVRGMHIKSKKKE